MSNQLLLQRKMSVAVSTKYVTSQLRQGMYDWTKHTLSTSLSNNKIATKWIIYRVTVTLQCLTMSTIHSTQVHIHLYKNQTPKRRCPQKITEILSFSVMHKRCPRHGKKKEMPLCYYGHTCINS